MGIEQFITNLEEKFWGGPTWATKDMTPVQRIMFFRDTGVWPGQYTKMSTEMFMQTDIDSEREAGKDFCAEQKLKRAREAGLNIT